MAGDNGAIFKVPLIVGFLDKFIENQNKENQHGARSDDREFTWRHGVT